MNVSPSGTPGSPRLIRNRDLAPTWTVKQAKEPGFMRSLITWVGGPQGYINTNPDASVLTESHVVGLMRMPIGNRQAGVHVHSVTEIYVILKGEVESYDGMGNSHRAGPLDCIYIPAGVPHGVRVIGDDDLELVWVHDAIEKEGVSTYLSGPGPFPSEQEVQLIRLLDLEPQWTGIQATQVGFLRWMVNWVGSLDGRTHQNTPNAVVNERMALGLTVILPWNSEAGQTVRAPTTYIIVRGEAALKIEGKTVLLERLDALHYSPGSQVEIRNAGDSSLFLLRVQDAT